MKRVYFRFDPADLKVKEPGFIPIPGRIELKLGSPVYFCLDAGGRKTPLRTAVRAKVGSKRASKPRKTKKWVRATGEKWQLDFTKLPVFKEEKEGKEVTLQPGFLLESLVGNLPPLVLVLYVGDDVQVYGMAGGEHGGLSCPDLAKDIEWHENHLSELDDIKKGCEGGGGTAGDEGGTIGGGGLGIGITLDAEGGDDLSELCSSIDFMISTAEKDLADAKDEYNKRCRPSV